MKKILLLFLSLAPNISVEANNSLVGLTNENIEIRIKAVESLVESPSDLRNALFHKNLDIRINTAEALGAVANRISKESLSDLIKALSDDSQEIRRHTVNIFRVMAHMAMAKHPSLKLDLSQEEAVMPALLKALEDSDDKVREDALYAYLFLYLTKTNEWKMGMKVEDIKIDSHLENLLLERLEKETSEKLQAKILKNFVYYKHRSEKLPEIYVKALESSNGSIREAGAKGVAYLKPPGVLPKLVKGLEVKELFEKEDFIKAIGAYGADAKSYLPQLERMLKEEENESLKMTLQSAIQQIQAAL